MNGLYKVYPHNPPHYFVPNAMYMVTGTVLGKQPLLNENRRKEFVLQVLLDRAKLFNWSLEAWAVLSNHYHFVAQAPENATSLQKFIQQLHSITAVQINRWDQSPGRQVWYNYWDSCLTYEKSYLARLHYVHTNAVKHGLVTHATDYPFCSHEWFIEQGGDDLKKQVFDQPIDRIHLLDDF
jgi:putative transposase